MIKKTFLALTLASLTSLTFAAIKLNVTGKIQSQDLAADVILNENGHGELHFENEVGERIVIVADLKDDHHVLVHIMFNETILETVELDVDNNSPAQEPTEGDYISVQASRVE